jgi:NAD(P)H-hydrate epimerase
MKLRPEKRFPLLPRKKNTDKRHYGHVLVLAGSSGMKGAAFLTSRAALVSGAGLTTLGMTKVLKPFFLKSLPELMTLELPSAPGGALGVTAYPKVMDFIQRRKVSSVALGPGLSSGPWTADFVKRLVRNVTVPMVLDADGLNSLKGAAGFLRRRRGELVLTPHAREFERVFSSTWPEDRKARAALAKKISKIYDVVLVLKGHRTLVTDGRRVYENPTGNPGMAKAGTGDVLTGILASFIGQGLDVFRAAAWAVYCHGLAGDLAVSRKGELSLTASDILDFLPQSFKTLE